MEKQKWLVPWSTHVRRELQLGKVLSAEYCSRVRADCAGKKAAQVPMTLSTTQKLQGHAIRACADVLVFRGEYTVMDAIAFCDRQWRDMYPDVEYGDLYFDTRGRGPS